MICRRSGRLPVLGEMEAYLIISACMGLTRYLDNSLEHTSRIPDLYTARAASVYKAVLVALYASRYPCGGHGKDALVGEERRIGPRHHIVGIDSRFPVVMSDAILRVAQHVGLNLTAGIPHRPRHWPHPHR